MISGHITKILTQKENDWGRYKIKVDKENKELLAVGVIPEASIGMSVVLEGGEEDTIYGHQFKISEVLLTESDGLSGIRRFLTDGYMKGIGLTKANAIIAAFGKESLDLFATEGGRKLLTTVKGVKEATIEKALPSYEENKHLKDIVVFLNGTGTKAQVEKIYEKYGEKALVTLSKNPYRLQLDLSGFGFLKADAIALRCGVKTNSLQRIMAAAKYVIEEASSNGGHCYLTIEEIRDAVIPLLAPVPKCGSHISEKIVNNALKDWANNRENFITKNEPTAEELSKIDETYQTRININDSLSEALREAIGEGTLVNYNCKIYTAEMFELEKNTAELLIELNKAKSVRFISKELIDGAIRDVEIRKTDEFHQNGIESEFRITQEQHNAVYLALMHRISIISGGPGRGKTAISEIVAHGFLKAGKKYNKEDIIMLAPTGRAAQRITESTGYEAMTAHRAIAGLKAGHEAPKGKLVLVDETSMMDIFLAYNVLKYAKDCNIVFVGDVDQIASVGPGKVLKDMIDCGEIPCILLKEGHRNSGTIAHNSELINSGIKIDKYCYDEHFKYKQILHYEDSDKNINEKLNKEFQDKILDTIINTYTQKVSQYGIVNVMLCSAMREKGAVCVNKLNDKLQERYTTGQPEAIFGNKKFRVGDRVMQTKNNYNFMLRYKNETRQGIFNGERGTVVKVNYDEESESYQLIVQFDDGSIGGYTNATAPELTLAYATTLHKCQGSEAACMIMTYTYGDYMLLNRSLFYTGETRAKKEFIFIGEEKMQYGQWTSAFDLAVKKANDSKRNTSLCEMLKTS